MKHYLDYELKGHALVFDGPLDLVTHARRANEGKGEFAFKKKLDTNWPGRKGSTWEDIERFVRTPWPEAAALVKACADDIRRQPLPLPPSVKRKARWSDEDGELDTDRLFSGEQEYMRQVVRQRHSGPTSIALVNNLDLGKNQHCNASGVFFRSACCIALADVLEDLGYTVEIWCWCLGRNVYPEPYSNQFIAVRPKEAGKPVDYHAICDTMSCWFTTTAVFGAFATCPVPPVSYGSAVEEAYRATDMTNSNIGPWQKYLDFDGTVIPMIVPMIRSYSMEAGYKDAARVAVKILENLAK